MIAVLTEEKENKASTRIIQYLLLLFLDFERSNQFHSILSDLFRYHLEGTGKSID